MAIVNGPHFDIDMIRKEILGVDKNLVIEFLKEENFDGIQHNVYEIKLNNSRINILFLSEEQDYKLTAWGLNNLRMHSGINIAIGDFMKEKNE